MIIALRKHVYWLELFRRLAMWAWTSCKCIWKGSISILVSCICCIHVCIDVLLGHLQIQWRLYRSNRKQRGRPKPEIGRRPTLPVTSWGKCWMKKTCALPRTSSSTNCKGGNLGVRRNLWYIVMKKQKSDNSPKHSFYHYNVQCTVKASCYCRPLGFVIFSLQ